MSYVHVHESLSIFSVRQGLISGFLTVNDVILKLYVIQFIGELSRQILSQHCWQVEA